MATASSWIPTVRDSRLTSRLVKKLTCKSLRAVSNGQKFIRVHPGACYKAEPGLTFFKFLSYTIIAIEPSSQMITLSAHIVFNHSVRMGELITCVRVTWASFQELGRRLPLCLTSICDACTVPLWPVISSADLFKPEERQCAMIQQKIK